MIDDFNPEEFAVNIDGDCYQDDFDEYDLFGEIMEDDNYSAVGEDIKFE